MLGWLARQVGLNGYGNTPEPQDALRKLQEDLTEQTGHLHEKLQVWRERQKKIIAEAPHLMTISDEQEHTRLSVKLLFSSVWDAIRGLLMPASLEIDSLINSARPHLQKLHDRLLELCDQLSVAELTEEKKIAIQYEICSVSIIILGELLLLRNKIASEIELCLRTEELEESVANKMLGIIVEFFLQIPLPETDFTLSTQYRSFLFDEVAQEEAELDNLAAILDGTVMAAEEELENKEASIVNSPGTSNDRRAVRLAGHPSSVFYHDNAPVQDARAPSVSSGFTP